MKFWKNFFENLGQNYLTDAGFSRIMMERFSRALTYGGIAQLARAFGSYPKCHRFKSSYRYQRYKVSLKYPGSAAIVTDKLLAVLAKSCILIRPVGQAVKTRPFHGCNMGSIPVRVKASEIRDFLFFLLSRTSILPHFAAKGKWGFCFIKSKRKTKKKKITESAKPTPWL